MLTTGNSRVSYIGMWYDGVNRSIASANYGTTSFDPTMVTSPPASTANVLVTLNAYNNQGDLSDVTDPMGMVTHQDFDNADRVIQTIQNYQPGVAASADVNITVQQTYSPDGNIATLTAVNPTTGDQVTTYLYGTTLATSGVARSDLLASVVYPAATDGTDSVSNLYNRQSEVQQKTDQNGTVHQYNRDGLAA